MSEEKWIGDHLNRHKTAALFEKIAAASGERNVFLVNAGFGQGKTFFVEKWCEQLEKTDRPVISFNAWKHDFSDNALAAFISSLNAQVARRSDSKAEAARGAIRAFSKKAAPVLLKSGSRIAVRLLSMGVLDGDIDSIKEAFVAEGMDASRDISNEVVKAFVDATNQERMYNDLSASFSKVVTEIGSDDPDNRVFIIVDELDRCRPQFVFDLLEDIKHILHHSNAVFFIFCDEYTLLAQASKIFGDRRAGETYIRKFFDHRLVLPKSSRSGFCLNVVQKALRGSSRPLVHDQIELFKMVLDQSHLSLRQIEHTVGFCRILLDCSPEIFDAWRFAIYLIVLREEDPSLFKQVLSGEATHGLPSRFLIKENKSYRLAEAIDLALKQPPEDRISDLHEKYKGTDGAIKTMLLVAFTQSHFWDAGRTVRDARVEIASLIEEIGEISH